jgi:hypothetical protein
MSAPTVTAEAIVPAVHGIETTPTPIADVEPAEVLSTSVDKGKEAVKNEEPHTAEVKAQQEAPLPGASTVTTSTPGGWPTLKEDEPLAKLLAKLPEILKTSDYSEIYGVTLVPGHDFPTLLILQKFLRANQNDLAKAEEQLLKTLQWRKEFNPLAAVKESFAKEKFEGLGYVTTTGSKVVTWNIYGAVKDYEKTFGDLDAYVLPTA